MDDLRDPRAEYTRRRDDRRRLAEGHERLHIRIGNARLILGVAAVLVARWAWHDPAGRVVEGLIAAGFIALVVIHDRALRARDRARRAVELYDQGLARVEDRWAGVGPSGSGFLPPGHRYAADLDLLGEVSLFQLLATARTRVSEETLARWLLDPAPLAEIRARQSAIEELRARLDFREEIALLGEDVNDALDSRVLPRWGEEPALLTSRLTRFCAALLTAAAGAVLIWLGVLIALFVIDMMRGTVPVRSPDLRAPLAIFAAIGIIEWLLVRAHRGRMRSVLAAVESPGRRLTAVSRLFARLETEEVASAYLAGLRRDLISADTSTDESGAVQARGRMTTPATSSREIARLRRIGEVLDSRDNFLVRLVAPVLLWDLHCAFAIEAWRRRSGRRIRRWVAAAGEYGALVSLSGYAYEHPADPFPELVEGPVCFDGEGLGHPLLPDRAFVRNDLHLDAGASLLVVSGSNMSGKSTFLRTVGVNVVLAMTGAPVRARRLRLSPFALGASIRVFDSLQDGSSRFYAEITRLREIMDLARGPLPLLFLLDELLHGTNSHDRRIGGEAIMRGLVGRGATGLVTTHDLALTAGVETFGGRNAHFEDHLEAGEMRFDYRLKDGVVRKSNALELMRWVGLEV